MFTGIVEEVGTVERVQRGARSAVLHIKARTVPEDLRLGDSVAVNGVCLTVVSHHAGGFAADVMHETLDRSALADLRSGSRVNLERAMAANGRFGGHIVAGHVDGTGRIARLRRDDNAVWYTIQAGPEVLRYVVEKGSIAVDGISLTVARVEADRFSLSVIPHTAAVTTLGERRTGDRVNLECDVIGKYVEKLLRTAGPRRPEGGLTREFLAQNGI
ncbi:MAG TPA: riboflavin synthase [Candidatus Intestinimonas pullistercoris]|uniref:Riboflavin synthase n=1 Tax=Candidatus Intestinimonas pullistercoris TaxID=2838623 RepID=A0A9D2NX65_9FIRM|nr:riboflavin synthase [uncultured Intestinimonas sp.]HJC40082.1 riboflavin synthase [Candidatus Intestinimonas pullistercoris]